MKHIVKLIVLASAFTASAQVINVERFGNALGGWKTGSTFKKLAGEHAEYKIDNSKYRTFKPTITAAPDNAQFVTTRVETAVKVGSGAVCFLETSFNSSGELTTATIKIHTDDKRIDSGTVVLQLPSEDEVAVLSPTNQLITDLFTALDSKIEKLNQGTDEEIARRDVFGRVGRLTWELEDLSGALRHNLNLLLGSRY